MPQSLASAAEGQQRLGLIGKGDFIVIGIGSVVGTAGMAVQKFIDMREKEFNILEK